MSPAKRGPEKTRLCEWDALPVNWICDDVESGRCRNVSLILISNSPCSLAPQPGRNTDVFRTFFVVKRAGTTKITGGYNATNEVRKRLLFCQTSLWCKCAGIEQARRAPFHCKQVTIRKRVVLHILNFIWPKPQQRWDCTVLENSRGRSKGSICSYLRWSYRLDQ